MREACESDNDRPREELSIDEKLGFVAEGGEEVADGDICAMDRPEEE